MGKENKIVKFIDFILFLYSNLLPGSIMNPVYQAVLILDIQLCLCILLFEKNIPQFRLGETLFLSLFFILLLPIAFLIKWRNKKNFDLFKDYKVFDLPLWKRFFLLMLLDIGPMIILILLLKNLS